MKRSTPNRIREFGKEKNVVLYIDPEIMKEAKALGLNVSKIAENALKEAIRYLKGENCQNILNSQPSDGYKSVRWCGSRDLNPQ